MLERESLLMGKLIRIVEGSSRSSRVIAEEVDDEDEGKQQQKTSSSSRTGSPVDRSGRPDVHNVHK